MGVDDRRKLLFKSLVVYDWKLFEYVNRDKLFVIDGLGVFVNFLYVFGFVVDIVGDDEDDLGCEDEDDFVFVVLDLLDYVNVGKFGDGFLFNYVLILVGNLKKIIVLLFFVVLLGVQESLFLYVNCVVGKEFEELGVVVDCIVVVFFDVEYLLGIRFFWFNLIIFLLMLFVFFGFIFLFEYFLFFKIFDFYKYVGGFIVVFDVV